MTTNAWGVAPPKPTSWAEQVDEEEEKHGFVLAPLAKKDDFPSLEVTKNVKESKKEKKKKQTMSLGEFMSARGSKTMTDDEILMNLPTAPRARAPGEEPERERLGGGFGRGGGDRYGGRGGRDDDDDRGPRRMREEDMGPSRAEVSDNWGRDRKFEPSGPGDRGRGFGGGSFRDRDGSRDGGFGRDRDRDRGMDDGPSRADTVDNWGANRQFVPSTRGGFDERPRGGGFDERPRGGGFGDRDRSAGGFGDRDRGYGPPREREFREPSKADLEDRWERKGDFQPTAFEDRPRREFDDRPRGRGFGESWSGAREGSRDMPRRESVRDDRSRDASQDQWRREGSAAPPSAEGSEGPRERPRLNLAPRSVASPADKEATAAAAAAGGAAKPNPFGAARPREEVLKEQGRDYRKEELQLEHKAAEVLREETEEELELQKQIEELRVKVEAGEADAPLDPSDGAEGKTVAAALEELELALSKLAVEMDDKVRFSRQQRGEGRDGPRSPRHEEGGRGFSQEREGRRYDRDSRQDSRRNDDREGGRGFDDRDRRGGGGFDDRDRRSGGGFDDRDRRGGGGGFDDRGRRGGGFDERDRRGGDPRSSSFRDSRGDNKDEPRSSSRW